MLGLFSCQNETKNQIERPFSEVFDFSDFIENKSGGLKKTVVSIEKIETQTIATPNWKMELQPFLEADFNKPAYQDKYKISEQFSPLTGWKDVTYSSTDENQSVKWATYRFADSTCLGAVFSIQKLTQGYDLEEQLTFLPNYGYSIDNSQTLRFIQNERFYLSGEFTEQAQPWKLFFEVQDVSIPLNCEINLKSSSPTISFIQGKEKITAQVVSTDSGYVAEMPVFQSYIHFRIEGDSLRGNFYNLDGGPDYIVPLTGMQIAYEQVFGYNPSQIFEDIEGKWEVYFEKDGIQKPAIGIFNRLGDDVFGTFATESGDYRFLQGKLVDNTFTLSTFDGSHLYLFTATLSGNEIYGKFYSGRTYQANWTAKRNEKFELANPNELTQLNDQPFTFAFPDLNGNIVSLDDPQFANKPIIVQIMGSWCPNCMDESRYFAEVYEKYHPQGLDIIALAFERSPVLEKAIATGQKAVNDLQIPYVVLIAGTPRETTKALPMVNAIKSYPTSIFLNRKHEVVTIHTGFYGPGTGEYYENYVNETTHTIEEILRH